MRVSRRRVSNRALPTERFWQVVILTAAGAIGTVSHADAALYYWQDSDPSLSQPAPTIQPPRQRTHRRVKGKAEAAVKETSAKPQGPLIIAVSIDRQKVRIFDDNGVFAEAPVSTGMRGHPTPIGVFSVIQKHKFHHSNIYSGAPMPFMQRITWSGVAMHAGVLPGYPASHGCIRMPMSFAVKMWNWTKMGARVFVTPGEIMRPVDFSHPLLPTNVAPQPVAAAEAPADQPVAAKADKGAGEAKSASSEPNLELRSTVGHIDAVRPAATEAPDSTSLRDQPHTADAGGNARATKAPAMMSDAPAGSTAPPPHDGIAAKAGNNTDGLTARHDETVAVDNKSVEAKRAEIEPAQTKATTGEMKPTAAAVAAPANDTLKEGKDEPAAISVKTEDAPDAKKDQARLADTSKPIVIKPEPPKRAGQISVFISRKDSKLYVRQNFAPLFQAPITIAASDRPLGTHVFTAEFDKKDGNILHWSVVSLPMSARGLKRSADQEHVSPRRKVAAAGLVDMKVPPVSNSAAEALDRITIPADAMARVTEALTTGSSIIVSDQGINQGETGEGTDFIVSLR
ncbi:MAG: L,D-transpeptidase [Alphaproteobacteria bacterium]|nr:MAG: L,D-transpeptidase [Alphaproteobacteria bacterium]